jgi:hypothetical protein
MFLNYFDILVSEINFKKIKIHYLDIFSNKKYFEKQPQPYFQIDYRLTHVFYFYLKQDYFIFFEFFFLFYDLTGLDEVN